MFRIIAPLGVALAFATPAFALTAGEKVCILNAANMVPKIPGLVIKAARATPNPKDANIDNIEIDIEAAGLSATYTYLCSPAQPAAITSTGVRA